MDAEGGRHTELTVDLDSGAEISSHLPCYPLGSPRVAHECRSELRIVHREDIEHLIQQIMSRDLEHLTQFRALRTILRWGGMAAALASAAMWFPT